MYVIGSETPQQYIDTALTFQGNTTIEMPYGLYQGDYQLATFFGKVSEDHFVRISNVFLLPVEAFAPFTRLYSDASTEISFIASFSKNSLWMAVNIEYIDLFAPKVKFIHEELVYQGIREIEGFAIPNLTTVAQLLSAIEITDAFVGEISVTLEMITKNGLPVALEDLLIGSGWKVTVTDPSGNVTEISIQMLS